MKHYRLPAGAGLATIAAVAALLVLDQDALFFLLAVAAGAPLTALLLVRAVADPDHEHRRLWPSFLIGAIVVPPIVLLLHSAFLTVGFTLVEPFRTAGRELLEELRADAGVLDLLTSGWTYFYLIELALVAPLAEETIKPLGAVARRPRTETDAFLFGAAAGTGFAVVENLIYASAWFWGSTSYWVPISMARMLGAGVHAFGAGMVAWGIYQVQSATGRGWRDLGLSFVAALSVHGLWNGTIAVTEVLYAGRSEISAGLPDDAIAWGFTLLVLLAAIGTLVLGALLIAGHHLRHGDRPLRFGILEGLRSSESISAWGLISMTMLIPATILVLVFPGLLAL